MTREKALPPVFLEPAPRWESDAEEGTGFEFPPDLSMAFEACRGPFRPDWERARADFAAALTD